MAFTLKIRSVQTTETVGQLDDDLWRNIRALARSKTSYFRKKDADKVGPQEEVLNLFHQIDGLMKQMTVKIINRSKTIATALAKEALTNPNKRVESIAKLKRLDQIFGNLQEDAGSGKLMANAVGNLANGMRKQIYPIMQNARAQLAQIIQIEKMAEQPQYSKKHEQEKRRRLEQMKRMEKLRDLGVLGEREKKELENKARERVRR